jgi:GntR family transcriptional regulator/MocR family aminotransferase
MFLKGPLLKRKKTITELGFVRLDGRKRTPLFEQLYDSIRSAILEGNLAASSRLPSSRDMVQQLGVSRTTVVSAIDRLIAEGYLQTVLGSGTFVSAEIPDDCPFVNTDPVADHLPNEQTVGSAKSYLSREGARHERQVSRVPGYLGSLKPFRPGVPALDKFPINVWAQIVRRTWKSIAGKDLSYGEPAGYFPLREAIAEYLRAHRGVRCTSDQVMIVSGTQQAVDMVSRLCVDPGDTVLFENPGYACARDVFATNGAKVVPMSIDNHGAMVNKATTKFPNSRLAYVTPSHQYPLGVTLPIERRMELIRWAGRTGGLILEDDYDSEYRYAQKPIPAMQGLDSACRTLYVGSFSKVIFPALSLAYVIVPEQMFPVFENAIYLNSRPVSLVDQYVLTDFIREGHFGRHLRRMRKTHAIRRETFVTEVARHASDTLEILGSEAGLHCSAILRNGLSDEVAAQKLEEARIIARPLSSYYMDGTPKSDRVNGLVFGFACATPRQIATCMKKAASILNL